MRGKGLEFNIVVNYNVSYVPAGSGIDTQIQNYVVTPGLTVIHVSTNVLIIHSVTGITRIFLKAAVMNVSVNAIKIDTHISMPILSILIICI